MDDVEEHRKIKGLKHSKVPMMVYSCGGFSRCFRVCRFYDVEVRRDPRLVLRGCANITS